MKTLPRYLTLCIGLMFLVSLFSCKKDEDDDDVASAVIESRDKFIGNYTVQDTLYNPGPNTYSYKNYTMSITEYAGDTAKIIISNLHNSPSTILATVSGNLFSISSESVLSGATTSGGFTLNGNKITFNLDVNYTTQNMDLFGSGVK